MNWNRSEEWYTRCVGEKGHYYHQSLLIPATLRLLNLQPHETLLDLGCGQGVLARALPSNVNYQGLDSSEAMIRSAQKLTPARKQHFAPLDLCQSPSWQKKDFDAACFLLSFQNMEKGDLALRFAAEHLKPQGRLLLVLNHPCFRIPRQSGWGVDANTQIQFRKVQRYMSAQKIPIQTHPARDKQSETTVSYHHPLSTYFRWLQQEGLQVQSLEEWSSDKKSEGKKAKMEDRAREEIPLFMAILATLAKKPS